MKLDLEQEEQRRQKLRSEKVFLIHHMDSIRNNAHYVCYMCVVNFFCHMCCAVLCFLFSSTCGMIVFGNFAMKLFDFF